MSRILRSAFPRWSRSATPRSRCRSPRWSSARSRRCSPQRSRTPKSWPRRSMGCGPISTELSRSPDKRRRKGPRPRPDLSARSQRRCARGLALTSAEESISMRINAPARLAVAWLTMFLVGTDLFVFSPLLPVLATDYHIALSLAGLSVTMFSLAYMVSAPLFGYFSDRIGRRRVLICSLLAFALANILTAGAANLPCLLAVRLFAGAAAAGVSPSIYALVGSAAPPDHRATWLALVVSGLLVSLAIGASAGGLVGSLVGGAAGFLPPGRLAGSGGLRSFGLAGNRRVGGRPGGFPRRRAAGIPRARRPRFGAGLAEPMGLAMRSRPRRSRYRRRSSRSACRCCSGAPLDPNGTLEYGPLRRLYLPRRRPHCRRLLDPADCRSHPLLWLRRNRRGSCGWPYGRSARFPIHRERELCWPVRLPAAGAAC